MVTQRDDVLGEMIDNAHHLPPWLVPAYAARYAERLGARDLVVLLQDYDQRALVPLTAEAVGEGATAARDIEGTMAGHAFMQVAVLDVDDDGGGHRLFIPLMDGADRVGVVELTVPRLDDAARTVWGRFAAILTDLIVAKGAHTDVYVRARRRKDMTLAAEMQWHLLPPLTVIDPRVALAGCLEPAYEVGGDAFDYAINHEIAHLAIFDAMGHGLDASVMSSVAVGAYRHARRTGVPVEDMYTLMDAAFSSQFGVDRFVTAQLANLHLPTGLLTLVNAGHPSPLLIRGRRVVGTIDGASTLPIGLGGAAPETIVVQLEPGDRLLLYSDGVVEARHDGVSYNEDMFVNDVEHVLADDVPLAETIRRLNLRLLDWRGGRTADDATLLLVEWRSGELHAP